MSLGTSPELNAARALRFLDPVLSELAAASDVSEAEGLARALLDRGLLDEPRVASELSAAVVKLDPNPLDGLFRLARDLVEIRGGVPIWREAVEWHLAGQDIDTDLLIAARLAWQGPPPRGAGCAPALAWPSVLGSNTFLIERVLSQEVADTHVHLGGALPGSFYWLAVMTGFAHRERTRYWSNEAELWPRRLAQARTHRSDLAQALLGIPQHLTAEIGPEPVGLGAREPPEAFVDPILHWLLPAAEDRSRFNPVLGERLLLWQGLSSFVRAPRGLPESGQFLDYLRVRGSFLRHLAYAPGVRGLARFQAAFRLRNLLFDDPVRGDRRTERRRLRSARRMLEIERFRTLHALRYQFSDPTDAPWARQRSAGTSPDCETASQSAVSGTSPRNQPALDSPWRPARQVELRVSPVLSTLQARVLRAYLQGLADFLRQERDTPLLRLGLVFHVLRGSARDQVRDTARWQIQGIYSLLESLPDLRPFVVGIDAAGEEVLTPPRDLAESFLWLRDQVRSQRSLPGHPPIHLRRTLHAGEDFRDLLTGLRFIDEAVDLLELEPGERLGHGLALAVQPESWYRGRAHVYPQAGDHVLDLLWALRHLELPRLDLGQPPEPALAHGVRGRLESILGSPRMRLVTLDLLASLTSIEAYPSERHVLAAVCFDVEGPIPVKVDSEYQRLAQYLRQRVREQVERAEIVLEACPTSNLLIGRFGSYSDLPYLEFNRFGFSDASSDSPQVLFSINSDDPGMFQTTVANEYRLLGEAMVRSGKKRREVLRWLDEARRMGLASIFIPPWSPPSREELLASIDHLTLSDRKRQ